MQRRIILHLHLPEFRRNAAGKATTMGHIQRRHLSEAKLAMPPDPLLQAMDERLEPMIEALWKRQVQSRTLAGLRDALLLELISGELWVKDRERFLTDQDTAA
jgi:type I restriction enzyme, S subunit